MSFKAVPNVVLASYEGLTTVGTASQLVLSQLMLKLPWKGLEHEAGVGVNTKLVNIAGAGVVNT